MTTGNFLDVLILFGSIQGFISAFLLFRKKGPVSNVLLAWILVFTSMACLNIYLFQVLPPQVPNWARAIEMIVPLIIVMPLGPLLYFYVKSLYGFPFKFRVERPHFASTLLDLVPSVLGAIAVALFAFGFAEKLDSMDAALEIYHKYVDIPRWVSFSVYLGLGANFFLQQKPQGKTQAWVRQFLIVFGVFQVLWLLHLVPYIVPNTSSWLLRTLSWYPVYVPLTILVYWLGLSTLIQSKVGKQMITTASEEESELAAKLSQLMTEGRLFLDPSLSLGKVMDATGMDQKTISKVLNQYLGKSFNEYVNEYRVEEVKRKLKDPAFGHLSITGIALESGFNSQATFQRAFKAVTKSTPKAYQAAFRTESKSSQI